MKCIAFVWVRQRCLCVGAFLTLTLSWQKLSVYKVKYDRLLNRQTNKHFLTSTTNDTLIFDLSNENSCNTYQLINESILLVIQLSTSGSVTVCIIMHVDEIINFEKHITHYFVSLTQAFYIKYGQENIKGKHSLCSMTHLKKSKIISFFVLMFSQFASNILHGKLNQMKLNQRISYSH